MLDPSIRTTAPFLCLPLELRVIIYSFALSGEGAVTISTAELVGSHYEVTSRLYDASVKKYWGLPHNHEPVVEETYDAALLSATNPAFIPVTTTSTPAPQGTGWLKRDLYNARTSLLLVNRQVNNEVCRQFPTQLPRDARFFIQFPHGLHVLQSMMNALVVHRARSVHLAGTYTPRGFSDRHAAYLPHLALPSEHSVGSKRAPDTASQLGALLSDCLGFNRIHEIELFEMRVYYPGADSYSTVWGDDSGPVCVALRNIPSGRVMIEVWRGIYGTGVYLRAQPSNEGRRDISTAWRRLEEGRRGEPGIGTWVVDPRWPACDY